MTRRKGTYPTYRYSLAPADICMHCWKRGGPPVPGVPFVWGYPSLSPGKGPPGYYCPACQTECRTMNIVLIPWADPLPEPRLPRWGKVHP